VKDAIEKATAHAEEKGIGKLVINYKLRDANFSRQRYWGEPFPVTYDVDGIANVVAEEDLPVVLPETGDFQPTAGGNSPLARLSDWVTMSNGHTRETDTMPAVAGSSWYFLRYMDPDNADSFVSPEAVNYWQSVDLYVGGAEHAVAHLLYARFWHKFLFDLGLVPTTEPFKKLINQGMIQGVIEHLLLSKSEEATFYSADLVSDEERENYSMPYVHIDYVKDYSSSNPTYLDQEGLESYCTWRKFDKATFHYKGGETTLTKQSNGTYKASIEGDPPRVETVSEVGKMSKSRYNVINPDAVISRYGTDCFRMYEMFLGPIEQSKPWDTNGIDGVSKFLRKFQDLFYHNEVFTLSDDEPTKEELKILHSVIKKVSSDIEAFSFNTSVSAMMIAVNDLRKIGTNKRAILEPLVRVIAPFAPFISEELWSQLGGEGSIHHTTYPKHDEAHLVEDSVTYPICVNGKKKTLQEFDASLSKEDIEKAVKELSDISKWTDGKEIRKVIIVPGRMVNLVV